MKWHMCERGDSVGERWDSVLSTGERREGQGKGESKRGAREPEEDVCKHERDKRTER